jgi:PAS domain S-box-containing protein
MSLHDPATRATPAAAASHTPAHGGTMRVAPDALLDGLDAIVWEMDPGTCRFTFVSAGAARILGYPAAQWVDDAGFWREHVHPDDRERVTDHCARSVAEGMAHELEYRMIAADGRTVWLCDRARVVGDGAGGRLLHGVMIDMSAQKLLERDLRASEERFARLSNASVDGVIVHEGGRIVDVSAAAAAMLGYTPAELVGRAPTDLTIPEERPALVAHIMSASDEPIEGHALMKDGRVIPVELRGRGVPGAGGVARVVILRDISERRRAEQAMRDSESRLRVLLQQMPALLWTTDRELRSTSFVGRGMESYGISDAGQVAGYGFRELLAGHPDEQRLVDAHVAALEGRASTYTIDWRGARWECHIEPLRDATGAIEGVIGLGIDVSDRVRAEVALRETELRLQQSQKLEAVGRLAGGIAHDFNNLLTVITGFTQMMLEGLGATHPHAADLQEVQRAAARAAELTRQLLAFSRRQVLQPVVLDLDAVVGELEKMLHRVIGEQVQLRTERGPVPARISADRGQVEQVVMNLVVNARDAMPDGGTIRVRTAVVDVDTTFGWRVFGAEVTPGRWVRLDVVDTGIGMDAAVRSHMFEPFFTTKPLGTGTGLGLPMAYGIVQQSGGYIVVDTAPGRGTTFSLYFPQAADEPDAEAPQPTPPPRGGAETILIVEDEDAVRDVARRILAGQGYVVLTARHAAEALAIAESHVGPIDLVLTDIVMPGLGGPALAERLSAEHRGLRVLFMTGYTDADMLRRDRRDTSPPVVMKPFTIESLLEAVRAVLDRARA